jgi:adenylate cyclase
VSGEWALAALAAGACALLAWLWRRARGEASRLHRRLEDAVGRLERLQYTFSRFAPDPVIERAIAGGLDGHGEKKEVTVLFADLAGYTPLAETLDPSRLVGILNGYFERMSRVIREHRGRISTFLGDGVLALFGAFEPNPWQGDDAARAALAMRAALAEYNRELAAQGLPPLAFGVGLHRGVGVAGLIGSADKKEFAIVGRTVNVAARVQVQTRQHEADILLTEDLARTLAPSFRLQPLPAVELKGVSAPVVLYALEGEGPL